MQGSKSKNNKAQHIVSAWCDSDSLMEKKFVFDEGEFTIDKL